MWRAEPERHCFLAIGADHLEWGVRCLAGKERGWQTRLHIPIAAPRPEETRLQPLLDAVASLQQRLPEKMAQIGKSPTGLSPFHVCVSDYWLAMADFPWNPALLEPDPARTYAFDQLASAGFALDGDERLCLDDRVYGERFLAVAYPQGLDACLTTFSRQQGLRLVSLLPLVIAASAALPRFSAPHDTPFALLEGGWIRFWFLHARNRRLQPLGHRLPVDDAAPLPLLWRRQCLRYPALLSNRERDLEMLALDGDCSMPRADGGAWRTVRELSPEDDDAESFPLLAAAASHRSPMSHALDAVSAPAAPTHIQWFSMAALAAAITLVFTLAVLTEMRTAAILPASRDFASIVETAPPLSATERKHVEAVNQAAQSLNLPFDALLRQLRPPLDIRVSPLEIELGTDRQEGLPGDAGGRSMKLVMEVPTAEEMTRYVAFLSDRSRFSHVRLARHEINESDASKPYRFVMELRWRD